MSTHVPLSFHIADLCSSTFSLEGDPLLDTSTSTLIPIFTAPLTRVIADVVFLENIATAKAAIEVKAGLETGRRISLVSFAPLGSSFVAASVPPSLFSSSKRPRLMLISINL